MKQSNFQEAVDDMRRANPQFEEQAYYFIREALDFTIRLLNKPTSGKARHVSGAELLEGIRKFAIQEFGPITKTVLNHWGIHECEDFGRIVFIMVEHNVLGKTDYDSIEDFAGGYDFVDAFRKPFLPSGTRKRKIPSGTPE